MDIRLCCLWNALLPQRLHTVWVLVCLLPKDEVPFVWKGKGGQNKRLVARQAKMRKGTVRACAQDKTGSKSTHMHAGDSAHRHPPELARSSPQVILLRSLSRFCPSIVILAQLFSIPAARRIARGYRTGNNSPWLSLEDGLAWENLAWDDRMSLIG